ncbi:leucyl aminopeptidase [Halorhodospira sp. 9621]|uniref:leucyl aminopeptidase n=1 Tax=Halorhodospira sp. 9621 TaxID=2899135 RepID=UPI001EE8DB79|nr:leucyl aminopeptidase [Halorhodospira sp. 9621]MCG5533855.1 leucyl aminopeptidase [Halorhodospira sp. 9621]
MELRTKSGDPARQRTACVVVGVYERRRMSEAARAVDTASDGYISHLLRRGDLDGEAGQTLLLPDCPGVRTDRVLLVGCGRARDFSERTYRKAVAAAARALEQAGTGEATLFLPELPVRGRDVAWRVATAAELLETTLYRFDAYKSDPRPPRRPLRQATLAVPRRADLRRAQPALTLGQAAGRGANFTRDLGNTPANICTPGYLGEQAEALAERFDSVHAEVLGPAQLEEQGLAALMAVARGAETPPRLIVIHYRGGADDQAPVALVGKGITFDSGGISIKPSASMDEMKYDMSGAAAVFGAVHAAAEAQLPLNLVAIIPATENMPDGRATRPGDIIDSLDGQRIEVLNTDAEGRLVLADGLAYTRRLEPSEVVDVATLTGAAIVGLGHHRHAVMGNAPGLVRDLLQAGERAADRGWELPLDEEYDEQLRSPFADVANIGGQPAGTITAGCFLQRFARGLRWAHLDIAGTAWKSGEHKGATGRPVPLLTHFLAGRAGWTL